MFTCMHHCARDIVLFQLQPDPHWSTIHISICSFSMGASSVRVWEFCKLVSSLRVNKISAFTWLKMGAIDNKPNNFERITEIISLDQPSWNEEQPYYYKHAEDLKVAHKSIVISVIIEYTEKTGHSCHDSIMYSLFFKYFLPPPITV